MEPIPPSNPAATYLDQTETEVASNIAEIPSNEDETPHVLKVRHANNRTYTEVRVVGKRQKKRTAWYWKHGMLMEENNNGKINPEHKWVCQLCRGFICYGHRSSSHINDSTSRA
jgi:hypothetical protein